MAFKNNTHKHTFFSISRRKKVYVFVDKFPFFFGFFFNGPAMCFSLGISNKYRYFSDERLVDNSRHDEHYIFYENEKWKINLRPTPTP